MMTRVRLIARAGTFSSMAWTAPSSTRASKLSRNAVMVARRGLPVNTPISPTLSPRPISPTTSCTPVGPVTLAWRRPLRRR